MLPITQYLWVYLTSVVVFFIIDMTWLGFVAKDFYRKHIGHLLGESVVWPVAISFYLIFLLGLLIFAIAPALESRNILHALIFCALFGFFTYATYDLTNWSTLKDWPLILSVVDILWGTILSASIATITYLIAVRFILS